jgi:hypothetical protein
VDKGFGRKVKADISLGASYLDSPGYVTGWTPVGGIGVSVRLRRTSIAFHYDRTRYQGLIVGRNQITNQVYASVSHVLARRVSLVGYGYHHDAATELDRGYSSATTLLGASVNVGIRRRTSASLSYSFLRFGALGLPTANSSMVNLSLSYARTWK